MGLFDNIKSLFITDIPADVTVENQLRLGRPPIDSRVNKRTPLHLQVRRRNYRIEATLKRWRQAVAAAQDPLQPDRILLYLIYDNIMEDPVTLREVRTARFSVQLGDYNIYRNEEVDDEASKLFDTPWFYDTIMYYVDTELWGHSLLEYSFDKDGQVTEVNLIPREHVRPEIGHICLELSDYEGIPYRESKAMMNKFNLIEIGRTDDIGLLLSISNAVIRKNYNLTDWGKSNERFGMPFIIDKTATRDQDELNKKQDMLENFGANGWAIIDDLDEIEFLESKGSTSGNGHKTFVDMNEYLDKVVTQLINGQTATSEEKSFVGSAEVQERVQNKYTLSRMKRIQYHINNVLIPFLISKGYPLDNCEFRFTDLDETEDKAVLDVSDASDVKQDDKKKD